MVNEVEVENVNAEPAKEYVYTIEHEVNVVNLSPSSLIRAKQRLHGRLKRVYECSSSRQKSRKSFTLTIHEKFSKIL